MSLKILITGAAGFIGFHVTLSRLLMGDELVGVDNLNDYYDVNLKLARLEQLKQFPNFTFYQADIADEKVMQTIFHENLPQRVVHLAAQAGVRYSIENPQVYTHSNLLGFNTVIELCRQFSIEQLVYASTSSVYGANTQLPYHEKQATNHPLSLYAATKKANELVAHSYSHLYQLPTIGLRFFTVYGPWGRPDMAFFNFTRRILAGMPIDLYHNGLMQRDFTYIDDVVQGINLVISNDMAGNSEWVGLSPDADSSLAAYRIFNIGYGHPVNLLDYIAAIEKACGKKAIKQYLPLQAGDVLATHADISSMGRYYNYQPQIAIEEGIARFVKWYRNFYQL